MPARPPIPAHLSVQRFGPVAVVRGADGGKYPDGNQLLVQGTEERVAFDTPLVAHAIGPAFDTVDRVILGHVHEDHLAGLSRLPPQVPVQVHQADLAAAQSWDGLAAHYGYGPAVLGPMRGRIERAFFYAPRPGATGYAHGAQWALGGGVSVEAHHLPGHTAGHCALVVRCAAGRLGRGLAFIGDIDLSGFGPYYGDATSSLADFRRSLQAVRALAVDTWVTSHHKGVVTDRADFEAQLAAFAARIDARDARLLQLLAQAPGGAATLAQLVAWRMAYQPGQALDWVDAAEQRMISQHLQALQQQGRVQPEGDPRAPHWRLAPGG